MVRDNYYVCYHFTTSHEVVKSVNKLRRRVFVYILIEGSLAYVGTMSVWLYKSMVRDNNYVCYHFTTSHEVVKCVNKLRPRVFVYILIEGGLAYVGTLTLLLHGMTTTEQHQS